MVKFRKLPECKKQIGLWVYKEVKITDNKEYFNKKIEEILKQKMSKETRKWLEEFKELLKNTNISKKQEYYLLKSFIKNKKLEDKADKILKEILKLIKNANNLGISKNHIFKKTWIKNENNLKKIKNVKKQEEIINIIWSIIKEKKEDLKINNIIDKLVKKLFNNWIKNKTIAQILKVNEMTVSNYKYYLKKEKKFDITKYIRKQNNNDINFNEIIEKLKNLQKQL